MHLRAIFFMVLTIGACHSTTASCPIGAGHFDMACCPHQTSLLASWSSRAVDDSEWPQSDARSPELNESNILPSGAAEDIDIAVVVFANIPPA
jgi:hypothetical protein